MMEISIKRMYRDPFNKGDISCRITCDKKKKLSDKVASTIKPPRLLMFTRLKKLITLNDILESAIRLLMMLANTKVVTTSNITGKTRATQYQLFLLLRLNRFSPTSRLINKTIQQNRKALI